MAVYTRDIQYIRFDATTATLTINVNAYSDGTFAFATGEVPCVLPVSPSGSVPGGADLVAFVQAFAEGIVQPGIIDSAAYLVAAGGTVSNAQDVFSLTLETEAGETPGLVGNGIPVIIFPDRVHTPSGNVFTRSIIAPIPASYAVPETGRFPSAYEQSVRLGHGIIDNGNVYTNPWPHIQVTAQIDSCVIGSPINSFTVMNSVGLQPGDLFYLPSNEGYQLSIDTIVGTTITFTTTITATPNAIQGLTLTFDRGTYAALTDVFDDSFVFGVDSTQFAYASAYNGTGLSYPYVPVPGHINSAYPAVFGGAAMLAAEGDPGFMLDDYLHYVYVEHDPITITSATGYGWFKYS
jgi:hypothetical protein